MATPELTKLQVSEGADDVDDGESKWIDRNTSNITPAEVRKIVSKVVDVGIRTVMRNHMYRAEGETRLQKDGGSIGLRLTGSVARCVMDHWFSEMRTRMDKAGFIHYFSLKYVDDSNWALEALRLGTYWNKKTGELTWTAEKEVEDKENGKTEEMVTVEIWKSMANAVVPMV